MMGDHFFGRSYAVVIGIGDYKNYSKLSAPADDAIKVRNFLRDQAGFDRIILLTDERATRDRIGEIMESQLPRWALPDDRVLFYFSGHGATRTLTAGDRGYLILAASKKDAWETMIDMHSIQLWSENLAQARHVLFLLDACFSGLAAYESKGEPGEETVERLMQHASHLVTAGVAGQESFSKDGESLFTRFFLQAARGELGHADNNVIGLNEIVVKVNRALDENSASMGGRVNMTPHVYLTRLHDNVGEFFFYTSNEPPKAEPKPKPDARATEIYLRRRIAELEARLKAQDAANQELQNVAAIASQDLKSAAGATTAPADSECSERILSADQIDRVRIKQEVRASGQKAPNSRPIYINTFSLAIDNLKPGRATAPLEKCILDAVDRVVYDLNPHWFSPSRIVRTDKSAGFQYAVGVWGPTALTASIYFKGKEKPVELKGFFSTQGGLNAFLLRPPA
jgi:hypothetical protein